MGEAVRAGYLRRLKTMKRKYFVLRGAGAGSSARLEYYESEKRFRAGAPAKRAIPLKSCFDIARRLDTKHKHVIALYTKDESFCAVLDSEAELRAWLDALLLLHRGDEPGERPPPQPAQHVWLVNVQKKGLGASKNIVGLYHLCLTDKAISLVKIKSNNNIMYDSCVPEHLEFSLKNIRRCGDSECFFYMEVGRLTVTGAGELWMHTDDNNIAQSMHTTILRAMANCTKGSDSDFQPTQRDRSMSANDASKPVSLLNRRQTLTGTKGHGGLSPSNENKLCTGGMCVGSCIKPCVTSSASYSVEVAAKPPPKSPIVAVSINEPSNNTSLIVPSEMSIDHDSPRPKILCRSKGQRSPDGFLKNRLIKHNRTVSLPTGCSLFLPKEETPRISHERTRSLPLAGDESELPIDKSAKHHSALMVNGDSHVKRQSAQSWLARRASTGGRGLPKWSPGHPKNGNPAVRNRCDSMPSRTCPRSDLDAEKTPSRTPSEHLFEVGEAGTHDEVDSMEWTPVAHRTPRIPEEPDVSSYCEMNMSAPREAPRRNTGKLNSTHHSRNSSLAEDASPPEGYLLMAPGVGDAGYVDMHTTRHPDRSASPAASSGSVASGTPSTDLRFSEYHLDPVTSRILMSEDEEGRPIPRAYSVGSRPEAGRTAPSRNLHGDTSRTRAFSVGSRSKIRPLGHVPPPSHVPSPSSTNKTSSAPILAPRSSADTLCDDLMELDFSKNHSSSPRTKPPVTVARTPPISGFIPPTARPSQTPISSVFNRVARTSESNIDEYVDMSPTTTATTPRTSGYVEMKPSDRGLTPTASTPMVTMARSPPVAISMARSPPLNVAVARSPPASATTPEGYMEMNYGKKAETRTPSRPILILSNSARPTASGSVSRASTTESERSTPPRVTPVMSPQTPNRSTPFLSSTRSAKKIVHRQRRNSKDAVTPISSQTIFPFTLESPASPARPFAQEGEKELDASDVFDDDAHYADVSMSGLTTVREISEENPKKSPEAHKESPSDYVVLKTSATMDGAARATSRPIATRPKLGSETDESQDSALLSSNPMATKQLIRTGTEKPAGDARPSLVRATTGTSGPARFTPICNQPDSDEPGSRKSSSPKPVESALNRALRYVCADDVRNDDTTPPLIYASLDLETRSNNATGITPSTYTQIDFVRSEKLNTVDSN